MSTVKAVLFDLDGVLVDACELHRVALNKALEEEGYTITLEEHHDRYNGLPTKVKLQMLTTEKGLSVGLHSKISQRKQILTSILAERIIKPNKDIYDLLYYLQNKSIKLACCSNSVRGTVDHLLSITQLFDLVEVSVGNDEGVAPKPAPDIFLEGARRLNVSIEECVIVEDSPIGLKAAYTANPLRVIQVSGPEEVNLSLVPRIFGE